MTLQVCAIRILCPLAMEFSFNQFLPDSLFFELFKFTNRPVSEEHCLFQFFFIFSCHATLCLKGRKRHKGKMEKQKCKISHGRCLPLPCHASLNTVPTHHMSSCTWLFSNRWQKSWEEENVLLCDMFFFWYSGFCSCQSKGCFSFYYYKCIWGRSLLQLSIPLNVYFNASVIVLFFLNLT